MGNAKRARLLACGLVVAAAAACSNQPEVPSGVASANQPMQETPNAVGSLVWKKPGLNAAKYTSFIVPPAAVYQGADAKFSSSTNPQELASYVGREFRGSLGQRFRITDQPGPGTARLQLTLVGTSDNVPVAATASRIAPVGIVANVVRSSQGAPPTFTGTVTIEGQFFDARTNEPLATFITTRAPSAMDVGATLSSQDAHRAAVAEMASNLRTAMERAQTAAVPGQ